MLEGEGVRQIEIKTYQAALDVCDNPLPESEYQAKFSLYHTAAIALLDGAVGLDSFTPAARLRSEDLRRATQVTVADPYASSYPVSWGAEVTVVSASGARFKVSRKDCKGDPELALDNAQMRNKAVGLLQYGGLEDKAANQTCDTVLAMPTSTESPTLFSDFISHALS
jgi:2-methylcitrate dehydratase PrpD